MSNNTSKKIAFSPSNFKILSYKKVFIRLFDQQENYLQFKNFWLDYLSPKYSIKNVKWKVI